MSFSCRSQNSALVFAVVMATAFQTLPLGAQEWSRFRGPNGSGISSSTNLPVELGAKNKVFETEVPFGRSSPAVAGERIFLTAIEGDKLLTLALKRNSGRLMWKRGLTREYAADIYKATDSATPTPVTDGSNVYVLFHEAGLVSYDGKGKERWRVSLGPLRNYYGIAASPVLTGDTLLVLCDQAEGSFLLAVNKDTGKELWRRNRPARLESFTTPILYPDTESPQTVVVSGSRWVDAYDLTNGKSVWTVGGVGTGPVSSPVLMKDILFVSAIDHAEQGWPLFSGLTKEHDADQDGKLSKTEVEGAWLWNHFSWLDTDANGFLTAEDWERMRSELVNSNSGVFAIQIPSGDGQPEILWNYRQNVPYISSPVVYDNVLYMVKDGIFSSLDPMTGELHKRGRLAESSPKVYASPVVGDGKIYIGTLDGQVAVLKASAEWEVLAMNELGEEIYATPAILDGHIYVRTKEKLYGFRNKSAKRSKSVASGG